MGQKGITHLEKILTLLLMWLKLLLLFWLQLTDQ